MIRMTRKWFVHALVVAAVVIAASLLTPDAPPPGAAGPGATPAQAVATAPAARSDLPASRVAVAADPPRAPEGCAEFAEMFSGLTRTWDASRLAGVEGLRDVVLSGKDQFDALVARIRRCHVDAGERALLRVSESFGAALSAREPVLQCGGHLIQLALDDMQSAYRSSRDRTTLDAFVHSLLATLEIEETLAQLIGDHLLAGRPHLGRAHEQKVTQFLAPDPARSWLRPIGEKLLLTLWANLVAEGTLSQAAVDRLALVLAADPASPGRRAAILSLLQRGEPAHLAWILSVMEGEQDDGLVGDVAFAIAAAFAPVLATESVLRMQARRPAASFAGAWAILGHKALPQLRQEYEARLADGIDAITRRELIGGISFGDPEQAIDVLRMAFDHDPDPRVRARALVAAGSGGSRPEAERMLRSAIGDPAFGPQTPNIVSALANYCGRNPDPNVVQEIGQRLLAREGLPEAERRRVRSLMDRFTPQPGPSRR
jgi:hypothetical protein